MAIDIELKATYRDPASPNCLGADIIHDVDAIAEEDMTVVVSAAVDAGDIAEGEAEDVEREFKRFLALVRLARADVILEEDVGPTKKVDALWHVFIIHTQQYVDFSDRVLGGYLHHVVAAPRASGETMRSHLTTYFDNVDATLYRGRAGAEGIWDGNLDICWSAR